MVTPKTDGDDPVWSVNRVDATIRTLLFLGRDYEAIVEMPRGHETTLFLPRNVPWHEGQAVELRIPPEALQVWDRDGGDSG